MKPIYMDNNATTACDPAVVEAMLPFFTEQFGNASSIHSFGAQVGKAIKQARMQVQSLLGAAHDSEIVFTSCGTESDSTAILSALKANPERRTVITTVVEHPAILTLCTYLEKENYVVHRLRVDRRGRIDLDEYKSLLNERVAIVSAMWANNETGTLFPVEEMAEMAHEKGIVFHTDAVQAVGKVAIDLKNSKIDMLSLSGHKLHAPKGIGVLYVRRNTRFRPLLRGGHQERGRRAGTENSASIVGLGVACELAQHTWWMRTRTSSNYATALNGASWRRSAMLSSMAIRSTACQIRPASLSSTSKAKVSCCCSIKQGIAASSGSACTSGSLEPSHVMRAMAIPYTAAHGTIRFSLSRYNTAEEVDRVIAAVPPMIAQLRKISPYWSGEGPVANPEQAFQPEYA
jgi:cysteine desulfurase